jgi:hypothetical protein
MHRFKNILSEKITMKLTKTIATIVLARVSDLAEH